MKAVAACKPSCSTAAAVSRRRWGASPRWRRPPAATGCYRQPRTPTHCRRGQPPPPPAARPPSSVPAAASRRRCRLSAGPPPTPSSPLAAAAVHSRRPCVTAVAAAARVGRWLPAAYVPQPPLAARRCPPRWPLLGAPATARACPLAAAAARCRRRRGFSAPRTVTATGRGCLPPPLLMPLPPLHGCHEMPPLLATRCRAGATHWWLRLLLTALPPKTPSCCDRGQPPPLTASCHVCPRTSLYRDSGTYWPPRAVFSLPCHRWLCTPGAAGGRPHCPRRHQQRGLRGRLRTNHAKRMPTAPLPHRRRRERSEFTGSARPPTVTLPLQGWERASSATPPKGKRAAVNARLCPLPAANCKKQRTRVRGPNRRCPVPLRWGRRPVQEAPTTGAGQWCTRRQVVSGVAA